MCTACILPTHLLDVVGVIDDVLHIQHPLLVNAVVEVAPACPERHNVSAGSGQEVCSALAHKAQATCTIAGYSSHSSCLTFEHLSQETVWGMLEPAGTCTGMT